MDNSLVSVAVFGGLYALLFWATSRVFYIRHWTKPNWRGQQIPACMGSVWLLIWVLTWTSTCFLFNNPTLCVAVLGFGVLGLVDDLWGNRGTGGLAGHFSEFVHNRRVTTGAVKAIGGIAVGFLTAHLLSLGQNTPIASVLTWTVLIALCANAINLLDCRPGRAIKGASLLLLAVYAVSRWLPSVELQNWWLQNSATGPMGFAGEGDPILEMVFLPIVVYSFLDFRSKAMMGDVGSNALGALVGWYAMVTLSLPGQAILVALLLAFHLWTEKHSLTEFLARHPVLDWLDRVGTSRPKAEGG
ncbi:MAG: hypothetical protein HY318_05620 [Armatimonadetes bacterium]|nr:hypothetical protein [Armatimonadota bacterium]